WLRAGDQEREVVVRGLSAVRGPAPVAQALYEETAESIARRERVAAERRLYVEPARSIPHGRPTKHERRELERLRRERGCPGLWFSSPGDPGASGRHCRDGWWTTAGR